MDQNKIEQRIDKMEQRTAGICTLTNIMYSMINMTTYTQGIIDAYLHTVGAEFKQEEKRNWNMVKQASESLKARLERSNEQILKAGSNTLKFIQEDSNQFMRFYCLLLDRCGGNLDDLAMEEIRLQRMPSQGIISQDIINLYKIKK